MTPSGSLQRDNDVYSRDTPATVTQNTTSYLLLPGVSVQPQRTDSEVRVPPTECETSSPAAPQLVLRDLPPGNQRELRTGIAGGPEAEVFAGERAPRAEGCCLQVQRTAIVSDLRRHMDSGSREALRRETCPWAWHVGESPSPRAQLRSSEWLTDETGCPGSRRGRLVTAVPAPSRMCVCVSLVLGVT